MWGGHNAAGNIKELIEPWRTNSDWYLYTNSTIMIG